MVFALDLHAATIATPTPLPPPPVADVGSSVLRLLGALVFVIGLFLAAVWAIRRWQQTSAVRRHGPRLVILDVQSLGGRQSLYVVAYDRQRLLVGSSPQGVTLVTHLPEADDEATSPGPQASFATALTQILNRKAG
jgi:flagellar protein FliO/FliZ